jgi:hypothetical protein
VAPTLAILNSPAFGEHICFGSFNFVTQLPASRSAYSSIHERMNLAFGDLHFHVNTMGVLRLVDLIRSVPTESTPSSIAVAPPSPSSVGSFSDPESTPASTYYVECDAYHAMGPNDPIKDHQSCNNIEFIDHESATTPHTRHDISVRPSMTLELTVAPTRTMT